MLVTLCCDCHSDVGELVKHLSIFASDPNYFLALHFVGLEVGNAEDLGLIRLIKYLYDNQKKIVLLNDLFGLYDSKR